VPKTGQTNSLLPGDDGALQLGVPLPSPRFTINGNGTVTDNLTGLIWLQDANCFGLKEWSEALEAANDLKDGDCGLSDGSAAGNWRLPNVRELYSLINYQFPIPLSNALGSGPWSEGDPFWNVQWNLPIQFPGYWSSTPLSYSTEIVMVVGIGTAEIKFWSNDSAYKNPVWPVRGGR